MATTINRAVRRQLRYTCATKKGRICKPTEHGARPVHLIVGTDEVLTFRIHGTRRTAEIHCVIAFQVAQVLQIQAEYERKLAEYNMRKRAGMKRLKKPKRPYIPTILK